jgi:hypothetical protein
MTSVYVRGPADPYIPAAHFLRFLAHLDKGLRLRWSQRWSKWHLERRVARAVEYIKRLSQYVKNPEGAMVENDSWIRARDGYVLVRAFDPLPMFGDWTITALRWGDPWRVDLRAREALLFAQERDEELSKKRAFDTKIEAIAKDEYENMVWRGGERVAVPATYRSQDGEHNTEHTLGP